MHRYLYIQPHGPAIGSTIALSVQEKYPRNILSRATRKPLTLLHLKWKATAILRPFGKQMQFREPESELGSKRDRRNVERDCDVRVLSSDVNNVIYPRKKSI
jgi:hypothetical protein